MKTKRITMLLALAVSAISVAQIFAAGMSYGQILTAGSSHITIREQQTGEDWTFRVVPNAKIVRNGEAARLEQLVAGDQAMVITGPGLAASAITAQSGLAPATVKSSVEDPPPTTHEYQGSFVAMKAEEITFRDQDGKTQRSFPVDEKAKITRDGKSAKLEDLKSGDRLKITTEERLQLKEVATVIEATSQSQK